MDTARAAALAEVFARRYRTSAEMVAMRRCSESAVRDVAAAVIAIEMAVRGPFLRRVEWLVARYLLRLNKHERVARMSLGPAQVQLQTTGMPIQAESVDELMVGRQAFEICTSALEAICTDLRIADDPPARWSRRTWRLLGERYNGTRDYGDVLAATFAAMTR